MYVTVTKYKEFDGHHMNEKFIIIIMWQVLNYIPVGPPTRRERKKRVCVRRMYTREHLCLNIQLYQNF